MQKTQNYNLNKPELTDPVRVDDFNENAEIIDAALKTLTTAVGGCAKIAMGSYTGTGKYGSSNPTKLTVGFAPKIVLIGFGDGTYCRLFLPLLSSRYDLGSTFSTESYTLTWGDTYFSIYSASAYGQLNQSKTVYDYIVIG